MKALRIILFFSTSLFLLSCAQIVPLSGGEKDILPPKELNSFPKNGTTLFSSKTVIIEFDEYIQLKNLNSQLIVSPIMEPKPEVSVKGKKLVLKLPENLLPNTTYSINFGSAIEDITENNSYPNYKYVFSTGDFLDSLSYAGTVVNAFDLTPKEKVYVLLYDKNSDSIPYKELPKYIALTDKKGKYEITNIAEGDYKLFALKDINSNYLFDLPNEEIGFKSEIISLKTNQKEKRIELFEENHEVQYIKKTENKVFGKIAVRFNLPTKKLEITPLKLTQSEPWYLEEKNDAGDSLTLWLTLKNKTESLDIVFADNGKIIDTTNIDIINELKDTLLTVKSNITPAFDLNKNIILATERPIADLDTSQIILLEDSNIVPIKFSVINDVNRKYKIQYSFKENTTYQLIILPNTFKDIYALINDTISKTFRTKSIEDYGVIKLNITPNFNENYIIQLYRGKNIVRQNSYSGAQKINYNYLAPGDYEIKLIIDKNNNNKWDTGNYLEHLQPEKVIYYKKHINIRANWDNEIKWTIKE